MLNNLYTRFALIGAIILLCVAALQVYPLKGGPDLAGGVDLIYELDTSKYTGQNKTELATRVVEVLKKRVDPNGVRNLTWKVINNGERIEILMPAADPATRAARDVYKSALDSLAATNLKPSSIGAALRLKGEARDQALKDLAGGNAERAALLSQAQDAFDKSQAADAKLKEYKDLSKVPTEVWSQTNAATKQYDTALRALLATNVDVDWLNQKLEESDDVMNKTAADEIETFIKAHPSQADRIATVRNKFIELRRHHGGGFDDPADLQRLLRGKGVLEFRIAVTPANAPAPTAIAQAQDFLHKGRSAGGTMPPNTDWFEIDPKKGTEMLGQDYRLSGNSGLVIETSKNQSFVLLYTDPLHAMIDPAGNHWQLTHASRSLDPGTGEIIVNFAFDPVGGRKLATLTADNVRQPMAILLDDKALTAPSIRTAITQGSGIITFNTSRTRTPEMVAKEADELVQMLQAGSLPATVQPEPVSVQVTSSEFGADNINAGLTSAIVAVIAVIIFMTVYYTLSGWFASAAMLLNLLMTLSVMAIFGATWTLPGIAGLVLTMGMAVDANILINERIREELHRGASLWLAIRQGYDRVFWTIFDANLTASLTAIVLVLVGSEEVKGFGVTLLIGLAIHMFTALYITRTLMTAAVRFRILRQIDSWTLAEYVRDVLTLQPLRHGRWPFMKVITVTKIDWIGLRHYFWTVSAIISIAGLAAFYFRGEDKYDTEFTGGTQITFDLKGAHPLTIEQVRARVSGPLANRFKELAKKDPKFDIIYRDLTGNATNVVAIGNDGHRYKVVTPVKDNATVKLKDVFLSEFVSEFSDVLDIKPGLMGDHAADYGEPDPQKLAASVDTARRRDLLKPITEHTIPELFPGYNAAGSANNALDANDLTDRIGGVAILLQFQQPQTLKEVESRFAYKRDQFSLARSHDYQIIPLTRAAATAPTATPATTPASLPAAASRPAEDLKTDTMLLVAADPTGATKYSIDNESRWRNLVAGPELELVQAAVVQGTTLQGVTSFDAVVADQAKQQALVAIIISLVLIVIYVWVRFGGIRYGLGAILSLTHDAIIALAATVLSGYFVQLAPNVANTLLVGDFKINLTMIAAYLTIIGYSVNDTIVIFDRIRENRGRSMTPLTAKLVNDSINQCFGRTIWTTFTVFIVVLTMYLFGGPGVRGFSFAMLIGVFTGAYSTLAIASPMLLTVKQMAPKAKARFEPEKPAPTPASLPESHT